MTKFKFYQEKIRLLAHFIRQRNWTAAREEWGFTYRKLLAAEARTAQVRQGLAVRRQERAEVGAGG